MLTPAQTWWLAVGVLIVFAAGWAWTAWRDAQQSGFRPLQYPLYWFGLPFARILWRARIVGRWQLPVGQGAVVVCNHRSPVDPAFIALGTKRGVHWMVAREYFSVPVFGTWLRMLEAVPTRRGGVDTAAVKMTIRLARRGETVGIFPEGKINRTDDLLLPLRSGAVAIALTARVPIVPCYIVGSPYDGKSVYTFFFCPSKTVLTLGDPIDLSEYYDRHDDRELLDRLTLEVGRAMMRLAGKPDYEPELAGRRRRDGNRGDAREANS